MPKSPALHAPIEAFPITGDRLIVGGMNLAALSRIAGRTPFYVYDRDAVASRIARLRAALPARVGVHYAVKANPMPDLVRWLRGRVDGFDVASVAELRLALACGADPARISFAGPGKTAAEIDATVRAGATLIVESGPQLTAAIAAGAAAGRTPSLTLRINPAFELRSSGLRMGGGPSRFGVDEEHALPLLEAIRDAGASPVGIHVFAGSQGLDAGSISQMQAHVLELAAKLQDRLGVALGRLNLGGGFGVPYFPGERPLDVSQVCERLGEALDARPSLRATEVVLELGRYLVAEAGVYVCRVIERKESRGTSFLITDGGLHHNLAATGNLGQILRKNYPVHLAHRVHGGPRETVDVVGPLCTPLDTLASGIEIGRGDVGDLVAVLQSGAYGRSASPLGFLGHPPPAEILV